MADIGLLATILFHFCCVYGIFVIPGAPNFVVIHTPVGEIIGKYETVQFDGQRYTVKEFLGIPYAEPPIGNNRLKKPIPKAPFKSPFFAMDYGAGCLQDPSNLAKNITLSEDCLFLNIFVPENVSNSKMPVMVWIHGGGFVGGVSTYYASGSLSAFGQVIVVTINYRLAHMGFLRTNETFENFGLWDQHYAIKWVKDNIAPFGGDVNRITVFGESAGSESVVYQVLFPGNKNLFQRAIAQSMGINSGRAFTTNEHAFELFSNFSGEIGCKGSHDAMLACIRNKTTDEITKVTRSPNLNYNKVYPNKDNDFAPKHPNDMIASPEGMNRSLDAFFNLDFMMGSCSIDGALYLGEWARRLNITDLEKFKVPRDIYESDFIPGELAYHFTDVQNIPKVAEEAAVFVYTNWTNPNDDMDRNMLLVDYFTDSRMFVPMVTTGQLHAKGQTHRTYMYEFSIKPTTHLIPVPSWLDGPTKAIHADDTLFVFGFDKEMMDWFRTFGIPLRVTDKDIRSAKVVMTMWTNFAKTGDPNKPLGVPAFWPEYNITSQEYLDITAMMSSGSVKNHVAARRMAFWIDLLPTLLKPKNNS